jgi:hypothetical protein
MWHRWRSVELTTVKRKSSVHQIITMPKCYPKRGSYSELWLLISYIEQSKFKCTLPSSCFSEPNDARIDYIDGKKNDWEEIQQLMWVSFCIRFVHNFVQLQVTTPRGRGVKLQWRWRKMRTFHFWILNHHKLQSKLKKWTPQINFSHVVYFEASTKTVKYGTISSHEELYLLGYNAV